MPDIIPLKHCPRCNQDFPATSEYFWFDKSTKDGLYSRCRKCGKTKAPREILPDGFKRCITCKETFPATIDYFAIRSKQSGDLRGECIQCYHQRQLKWRDDNRDSYLDYHKIYRHENAEQVSNIKKEWYQRNKIRISPQMRINAKVWKQRNKDRVAIQSRTHHSKRKALILAVGGNHNADDIALQYKSQKGLCWWCGKDVGNAYHIDHRIPLSRGGTNWPENLCISCPKCNGSKHNKMPWEWSNRLL